MPASAAPLGFSSNLVKAETLDEVIARVIPFAAEVRRRLGWDRLGVDLRLGSAALSTGAPVAGGAPMTGGSETQVAGLARLRAALDANHLSAHTLNGFPLRPFQADRVKDDAYLPDWSDAERFHDSLRLLDAALALSDEPVVTISTVPIAFRPFGAPRTDATMAARRLGAWAATAFLVRQRSAREGRERRAVLALEPEPWCVLERCSDAAAFWRGPLAEDGVATATRILGSEPAGVQAVRDHLGLCLDTCHLALAYEDGATAVARLCEGGVPIAKVQITSAPEVRAPHHNAAGVAALAAMAEPRFLHQVAATDAAGNSARAVDLDGLAHVLQRLPSATSVRAHFHVPVDRTQLAEGLGTTAEHTWATLAAARAVAPEAHLAVETYTWPVLAMDEEQRIAGTVRELEAAAARLTGSINA
jgi:hypothetical protein